MCNFNRVSSFKATVAFRFILKNFLSSKNICNNTTAIWGVILSTISVSNFWWVLIVNFKSNICRIEQEFELWLPIIWEQNSEDFMDWHCFLEPSSLENTFRSLARSHSPKGLCLESSKRKSSGNFFQWLRLIWDHNG